MALEMLLSLPPLFPSTSPTLKDRGEMASEECPNPALLILVVPGCAELWAVGSQGAKCEDWGEDTWHRSWGWRGQYGGARTRALALGYGHRPHPPAPQTLDLRPVPLQAALGVMATMESPGPEHRGLPGFS